MNKKKKKLSPTLKEKVEQYFQNKPFIVLIWMFIVLLSSLVTLTQGLNILLNFYNDTIGYKQNQYEKLASLDVNKDITEYVKIFGNPTLIKPLSYRSDSLYRQYIFINKFYYLQAITESTETAVLSFAVTTRKNDFQPEFTPPGGTLNARDLKKIKLNKTTLKEVQPRIEILSDKFNMPQCYTMIGASRYRYFEGYYLAHPGNYQSFYIGVSDAGYVGDLIPSKEFSDLWSSAFERGLSGSFGSCNNITDKFREKAKINTYILTAPSEFAPYTKLENFSFGVDLYDVSPIRE